MRGDAERWKRLDEAEVRRQKQKSVDELNNDGYQLYCQCRYGQAAALFSQAALLARQKGDLPAQCENLCWEGNCYSLDNQLKKSLACFLKAEQLKGLDAATHFSNLMGLFFVAMSLHLPQAEIQSILDKLGPYKDTQQIGGFKSMVLSAEYYFLSFCNKDAEALAKAQEAFASRIDGAPQCSDSAYFKNLVTAYRLNGQIPNAWATLRRWRKDGDTKFADTKHQQLMEELRLYCHEDKFDDAWDTLQRIKAEEQYLGRPGMYVDTLEWEILIGTETGRMEQVKPALGIFFKKYRNSEDLNDRYICYKAFACYCCASCHLVPPENRERMERHAEFWLKKAEQMAGHLDGLMQATWRTEQIKKIHKDLKNISQFLPVQL